METMENCSLTKGPITKQLVMFALPLLAGSLIQQLYSTVDMMFVGRFLGKEAAAAVGSSGMLVTCLVGFFTGLSVGVGVVVGKAAGRGDYGKLRRYIHCAAALTVVLALLFLAVGEALAPMLLAWMDTPSAIMPGALAYIRTYLLSLVSIVSYNIGTGILKALGDSRSPTLCQLAGGVANVIGNYVLIVVLGWGVRGAALTTALSQTLAAALTVRRLLRLSEGYRLRVRCIRLEAGLAREILSVGIPAAVQAIVISLSNVVVQTNINRLGVESIAAVTAYYKVENLLYYPIMAVSQACSAFVSQNIGAGQTDRARRGTKTAIALGVGVTMALSAFSMAAAPALFGFFARDAEVIALGSRLVRITYPFYFIYVFQECYASSIRGAGKAIPAMLITVGSMCVLRTGVLRLILHFHPAVTWAIIVYPVTWICTAAGMYLYYRTGRWLPEGQGLRRTENKRRRFLWGNM